MKDQSNSWLLREVLQVRVNYCQQKGLIVLCDVCLSPWGAEECQKYQSLL